jgi:hypothetical protein
MYSGGFKGGGFDGVGAIYSWKGGDCIVVDGEFEDNYMVRGKVNAVEEVGGKRVAAVCYEGEFDNKLRRHGDGKVREKDGEKGIVECKYRFGVKKR